MSVHHINEYKKYRSKYSLIVFSLVVILGTITFYTWQMFHMESLAYIEIVQGRAEIIVGNQKEKLEPNKRYGLQPNAKIALESESFGLVTFSDGQTLPVKGQNDFKFSQIKRMGEEDLFIIEDVKNDKVFSYSPEKGLGKANASIIGKTPTSAQNVLGVSEDLRTKRYDQDKLEGLSNVTNCVLEKQKKENEEEFNNSLKACLEKFEYESLEEFEK
jgi:hypothetical protein